jgi:hypothetical protein
MASQVGHAPYSCQDTYGAESYGATTWYPAHIEQVILKSEGGGNATVTGRLHIILGAIVRIDPRDRLLVPAPFTSRNSTGAFSTGDDAQLVQVAPTMGPVYGQHHTEVWTE